MLKRTGFISQEQKERVVKATDIVQLIGEYVQLKPSGKNLTGLCPFHQEKTPSFTVSQSYQNYKCYGCGEYGDAIRFVMGIENLAFHEAIQFLAKRTGIILETSKTASTRITKVSEAETCLHKSQEYFQDNLKKSAQTSAIWQYLSSRDISQDSVSKFQLGFVPAGWQNLNKYLLGLKVSNEIQEKAGLIKKGDKGGFYDRLRNRLIFPIRDRRGQLIGFAGRAVGNEEPKYLNPPETDAYKKSSVFYGIDLALAQIRRKRRAILVEGYLDVIRLHENGWDESIATCGTALTNDHVNLLKTTGAEETVLLFDGDSAGIKAAEKSCRIFIENGLDSKVIILPEGLDPDDYFKKFTNQDFQQLLDNAEYDINFIVSRAQLESSDKGIQFREEKIKEIIEITNQIESSIKKDLFVSNISKSFGIERRKLLQILKKSDTKKESSDTQPVTAPFQMFEKDHLPEVKFIKYLMIHVEAIQFARKAVTADDFANNELAGIYARFLQLDNDEFMLLKAQDFPELFVEYSSKLVYMLHNDFEYKGPSLIRPGSDEMVKLKEDNDGKNRTFSPETLNHLIHNLKKNRVGIEKRKLRYKHPTQQLETLREIIENRKKDNTVRE